MTGPKHAGWYSKAEKVGPGLWLCDCGRRFTDYGSPPPLRCERCADHLMAEHQPKQWPQREYRAEIAAHKRAERHAEQSKEQSR